MLANGARDGAKRRKRLLAAGAGALAVTLLSWGVITYLARGGPPAPTPASPFQFRPVLDEAQTRKLFTIADRADLRYDPVAYITQVPNTSSRWKWAEHPNGFFVRNVNNLAFNEVSPTAVEKRGLRILVAGDSHTGGLENAEETFSNVAERALMRILGRPDVEVLNAGVGYTSPTCYLGMLHKHLALRPDAFVAVLFTGNDFLEETVIAYSSGSVPAPLTPDDYYERAKDVQHTHAGPFSQGLNQAYRWSSFPQEIELCTRMALEAFRAMKGVCDALGIPFLGVLLPTKMDVDEDDRPNWLEATHLLGLSEDDVRLDLRTGQRLFEALRAEGIECLDPTEEMVRSTEVLYWKLDYHIGVNGCTLLGERLATRLAELLRAPAGE